jgi:hypothetical protein
VNLYVSEQQYVYARGNVIVAINNDGKQAEISFATDLTDGTRIQDRLGVAAEAVVRQGNVKVTLPKRSAAIFVRKDQ